MQQELGVKYCYFYCFYTPSEVQSNSSLLEDSTPIKSLWWPHSTSLYPPLGVPGVSHLF